MKSLLDPLKNQIEHPNWRDNEKLIEHVQKALTHLPDDVGWHIEGSEMKSIIVSLLEGLQSKGYDIIDRTEWRYSTAHPEIDSNAGKWVNTIQTDGSTDLRLVIDLMEVLQPFGLIVSRAIDTFTFVELATIFSHMIAALRVANLGLRRNGTANKPWS